MTGDTAKNAGADRMSAYLDEELDPAEAEAFESFLAESPEAQEELEALKRVLSLVSGLPKVEAPEDFYDKLNRRIRRKQILSPDSSKISLIALPFQVLSIVVILVVAALYMMAQLDHAPQSIEADPDVVSDPAAKGDAEGGPTDQPLPIRH